MIASQHNDVESGTQSEQSEEQTPPRSKKSKKSASQSPQKKEVVKEKTHMSPVNPKRAAEVAKQALTKQKSGKVSEAKESMKPKTREQQVREKVMPTRSSNRTPMKVQDSLPKQTFTKIVAKPQPKAPV